jgi:hypothetical protein
MKLTEEQLETILVAYERLDLAASKAIEVGCLDPDGPLYDAIWRGFDDMLQVSDPYGWISWYIHDNEMGKRGLVAEVGCKKYKVKNLKTLLEVMNA